MLSCIIKVDTLKKFSVEDVNSIYNIFSENQKDFDLIFILPSQLKLDIDITQYSNVRISYINSFDNNKANIIGLGHAIGDTMLLLQYVSGIEFTINEILNKDISADVTYLLNKKKKKTLLGKIIYPIFNIILLLLYKVNFSKTNNDVILSRNVVSVLLSQSENIYLIRLLSTFKQFSIKEIQYKSKYKEKTLFLEHTNSFFSILSASPVKPMRFLSLLTWATFLFNVAYIMYVMILNLVFLTDLAEGWSTISIILAVNFGFISLIISLVFEYLIAKKKQHLLLSKLNSSQDIFSGKLEFSEKDNLSVTGK